MTPDGTPQPVPRPVPRPVPLQWQIGQGRAPDGTPLCQLTLAQGQLQQTVVLIPADAARLAQQLADAARQAGSALIVPTVAFTPSPNGHG